MDFVTQPRWEIPANDTAVTAVLPKLHFTYAGVDRTLNKHPSIQAAIRRGEMKFADARLKPWYLRLDIDGKERNFKLAAHDKDAIRAAKDILNGRIDHPSEFAAFMAGRDAKRGLTISALADAWLAAGLPFSKTKQRTIDAADRLRKTITRALKWWSVKSLASITHNSLADFVVWRRANVRTVANGTGSRSADLELAALSCLCQWAVITGRIEKNPFEVREKFCEDEEVTHCHESMPDNDDQFHTVLRWLFTHDFYNANALCPTRHLAAGKTARVAGAWLCFCALTGLRPGEPKHLQRALPATQFPGNLAVQTPGLIYPLPDGSRRMKIERSKRGQNPAVVIHPALENFLLHWHSWLYLNLPSATELFPDIDQDRVQDLLSQACRKTGVKTMKPHGFGRAYYVRVRRSQGADDITIGVELGQTSNGKLIRNVYGDPLDPVGGNLHDWLPANGQPAWKNIS